MGNNDDGKIVLKNIRVFAYHGCLAEEALVGSDYSVDVMVYADLSKPGLSDKLSETVDYVRINHIVMEEMGFKSKLLEHAAKRIMDRIFREVAMATKVSVAVTKLNPPINGDVEAVTVILKQKRP